MDKPKTITGEPEKEKPKKHWLQMGVELEGSWIRRRDAVAAEVRGAAAHKDQSVHIGHGDPGEIVTRPHDNLDTLEADIRHLYPDHVDVSCGFHIHASFTPVHGSILTSPEFYDFFKKEWGRWGKEVGLERNHEFWARLRGDNKFAKDRFEPAVQLENRDVQRGGEARYTMLNWKAWQKHGTVECRLLPMFQDKEIAISAVRRLAQIYDSWLSEHGLAEIRYESTTQVVGEEAVETYNYVTPDITPRVVEYEGTIPKIITGEDVYYAIDGAMDKVHPYTKDTKTVIA